MSGQLQPFHSTTSKEPPSERPPPVLIYGDWESFSAGLKEVTERKIFFAREELNPDCLVVWIKVSTGIKSDNLGGHSIRPPQLVHLPYDPHFITEVTLRHVSNTAYAAQYGYRRVTWTIQYQSTVHGWNLKRTIIKEEKYSGKIIFLAQQESWIHCTC